MRHASDDELVEGIREGDANALATWVERHRTRLLSFVERNTGAALRSRVEPADLVQDTVAEALRILPTSPPEREPYGWLCSLAERKIIDAYRRQFGSKKRDARREQALDAPAAGGDAALVDLLVLTMTTPSQAFSRDERGEKLRAALLELPEDAREALRLRYAEGLPSKEIAEVLGKSDGAVRVLLTRSLRKLEELLGPDAAP